MEVVQLRTEDDRIRYYLADKDGMPVEPVKKFLKFRDNMGYARNTLRMYCTHLKQFYEFLEERGKDYKEVRIDDLAGFVAWLQNPFIFKKVMPINGLGRRCPETINAAVDTVVAFYDYLLRHEEYEGTLSQMLARFIRNPGKNYKAFLHGIAESKAVKSHILKLPVPQRQIPTIKQEDISELLSSCTNMRDFFLLYLLYETGMRIGEALSLWLEDFDAYEGCITLHDRGEMENLAEIKTVSSPRKLDATQELMECFMDYVSRYHDNDVRTNHVFIKLRGENAGKAMDYTDVNNLFRRLAEDTGIQATPHMFRHTSLSLLYEAGWEPELLRKRAGHKNIYTTINTYVHPSDELVTEEFRRIEPAIPAVLDGLGVSDGK